MVRFAAALLASILGFATSAISQINSCSDALTACNALRAAGMEKSSPTQCTSSYRQCLKTGRWINPVTGADKGSLQKK
jgi:hypothetical protein